MQRIVLSFVIVAATLFVSLPAHAQLTRTFVSSSGVDTNPCTVAAPCATFAQAYSQVMANGIVAALDPGKYGPLTITGPVTIDGNGWASITAPLNGVGILIEAGTSDNVILRGIAIDGAGVGAGGVEFGGGALAMIECIIRNMDGDGLLFISGGATLETLAVADSHFIDNSGAGARLITFTSGTVTASFIRTEFSGNGYGLQLEGFTGSSGTLSATASDSVFANNSFGVVAQVAGGSSVANLFVTSSQITGNLGGVIALGAAANSTIWLGKSTVAGNAQGFSIANGVINSYGDNYFADNGTNTGSLTPVGTQ